MRERLTQLIDRPAFIRTVPDDPAWKPITGIVFEVRDTAVDVLTSSSTMKTVALARIVDVSLDHGAARDLILEDPPDHPAYPAGKRALFRAEESELLRQPAETTRQHAAEAAALLREVRAHAPGHLGTEQMLERAHVLATGRYDYELAPEVTGGEVDNFNYRLAKERVVRLDADLKARRPEDEIAGHLIRVARHAGRALAKYPAHAELRAWLARVESIRTRLSDETRRASQLTEPFTTPT